jgi:hypothetical protein
MLRNYPKNHAKQGQAAGFAKRLATAGCGLMMMLTNISTNDGGGSMKRYLLITIGAALAIFSLWNAPGNAGGAKDAPWMPILSEGAYTELSQRSIKLIEESAKVGDKGASDKIEVEAAILVGYTLSVKNPADNTMAKVRGAAFEAVKAARLKDLKKLTDFGKSIPPAPKIPAEVKDWTTVLRATEPMMKMFLSKAKGGEGIHADLQYHPSLKNLNGIEALISKLATKKLSDDNLAKVEKELPNLGYRLAVVASITHEFTPKKEVEKWRDLSRDMRDASIALAESARKKNGDGVLKAAMALENSCVECHSVFKSNPK